MKKKASLLISGITTVAMLAVAVGSFAAWNTLTADVPQVNASSSTPTVLTVTNDASDFTGKKLVPSDVTPAAGGTEVTKLTTEFTPTLTQDGTGKEIKLKTANLQYAGAANAGTLTMKIYEKNNESKIINVGGALTSDQPYIVEVEFATKDADWTADAAREATNKSITLDIQCEAVDTTTP